MHLGCELGWKRILPRTLSATSTWLSNSMPPEARQCGVVTCKINADWLPECDYGQCDRVTAGEPVINIQVLAKCVLTGVG